MSDQSDQPVLPTRRRSRWPWIAAAAVIVVVAGVIVGVVANRDDEDATTAGGTKAETVRIGVADAESPYWKTYLDLAKQRLNVTVELINFSDYSQPNPALKQKQLDLNQFQHIQYLANYNVTAQDDLQPIGATAVYPLPLYSLKFKAPADIPANAKIAIPNDAINQARGLLVLQAAGLLTLKNGGSAFSSLTDVDTKKVEPVALDASQTAGALQSGSVAGAIVNNNYATSAKLPRDAAIFQDDPASDSAAPYVNIFTARAADKDNPTFLKLAELYHDPAVEKGVQEANGNVAVLRTVPAADLQALLKKVQDQAVAAGK
ncbi:MetQ/NlpA family ABC transporter substrate-binding protein [Actinoplanes sp. L3-i22]|uniref:MetQ/NlpA family ABC transporter substrate-binding protein n=1 Tax=Actinoplanes sp. L3-i22 TaxID=2836373 RepID=UPI001C7497A2|nr:MetQ/NlpA family ABC transporter substrate-binding protein [Actinoplanes sp. L3-i22]BCY11274.1 ABC transporter substrate-binding protein [Actinoplanes sp. L3-i22]